MRKRHIRKYLYLCSLMGMFPMQARAEDLLQGIGVNIQIPFQAPFKPRLGLSFFIRQNMCFGDLSGGSAIGLQYIHHQEKSRLILAWQGGATLESITANLESGISLSGDGLGFHRGVQIAGPFSEAFVRQDHVDAYAGLGVSYLHGLETYSPTVSQGTTCTSWVYGRPLRDERSHIQTGAIEWEETNNVPTIECVAHEEIGKEWVECARQELDSVPAFLQMAWELMAYDAPAKLVEKALRAAEDEIRHSIMCVHMAQQYYASKPLLSLPEYRGRPLLPRKAGLHRLALESWTDGCLGEGFAARCVGWGSQHATRSGTQAVLRQIADDEHQHAQLAWDVIQWAISQDSDGSLREKLSELPYVPLETYKPFLDKTWEQHGFGAASTQDQLWESMQQSAQYKLRRKLERSLT